MKKIMLVFGTRPEAIKMCPLVNEFQKYPDDFETTGRINNLFLVISLPSNDEYAATNPKTEEVKALKQVMDTLHQGHYATI